ncbi:MAG: hypothetical protein KDB00_28000, partial [Planctomycetales bacterium]|nr:hypothetical protein [Planctomycetales bacterium]
VLLATDAAPAPSAIQPSVAAPSVAATPLSPSQTTVPTVAAVPSATTAALSNEPVQVVDSVPVATDARTDTPGSAPPMPKMQLTTSNVAEVFATALRGVQQMTASIASMAEVRLESESKINLVFPAESSMSMKRMDLPEHRGPVCEAISNVVGRPITLQLIAGAASPARTAAPKPAPKATAKERMERMREIEAHPWVQSCVETFGAEIVKVDPKQ